MAGNSRKAIGNILLMKKSGEMHYAKTSDDTSHYLEMGFTPVTKNYFNKQIGGIEYGVVITEDKAKELKELEKKSKGKKKFDILVMNVYGCCKKLENVKVSQKKTEHL